MYDDILMKLADKRVAKTAFVPPGDPAAMGAAPPVDPAAAAAGAMLPPGAGAGMPPIDPAAMGAAMSGMPPAPPSGDPAMAAVAPAADPAMAPAPAEPAAEQKPAGKSNKIDPAALYTELRLLRSLLTGIYRRLDWDLPVDILDSVNAEVPADAGQPAEKAAQDTATILATPPATAKPVPRIERMNQAVESVARLARSLKQRYQ